MERRCIYCRQSPPNVVFAKAEHVLPQAFGRFKNNLTLHGVVCDECNAYFGNELELDLARNTPDGFERFRLGVKPADEYKSVGSRTTLAFSVDPSHVGPLAGVHVVQRVVDGELLPAPAPQIGFGRGEDGPWEWFLLDALPSRERVQALYADGYRTLGYREITDITALGEALAAIGVSPNGDRREVYPAHLRVQVPIRLRAKLTNKFGRVLTKIALNYLASQYGARTALMPQFDDARAYARYDRHPSTRIWDVDTNPILPDSPTALGHILAVGWEVERQVVLGVVSFHNQRRYTVRLAEGGFAVVPFKGCGHFFDVASMNVSPMTPLW